MRRQLKHISKYSKYWNSTSKTTGDINNSLLHFASKMCTTYTNIRFLLDTEVVIKCSMKWKLKFHLVNVKSSLQFLTLFIHYSFFHRFKCENLVLSSWSTDIQEVQLAYPLKFASVSFYCQVSDTGSVGWAYSFFYGYGSVLFIFLALSCVFGFVWLRFVPMLTIVHFDILLGSVVYQ
jgi:hypothetical protein